MPANESELRASVLAWREAAKAWFAQHGHEVTIVIPSYRDHTLLRSLFEGLEACTAAGKYRVIVTDDASNDPDHDAYLASLERTLPFVTVLRNAENGGFAANVNRALRIVPDAADVVLMNSDIVPLDGWLAALQYSLHLEPADLIAPKMLYPDGTIQFCGGMPSAPGTRSFDHRFRHRAEYFPPATVRAFSFYATGAVLYIPAATRARIGGLDEGHVWGHDDVDYALRCWLADGRIVIEPRATVTHLESATMGRGSTDARIARSTHWFWDKNHAYFDRIVRGADGRVRVILVIGGLGTPDEADSLLARVVAMGRDGFACEIWNFGGAPHFLGHAIAARGFGDLSRLAAALDAEDAIKICTDWHVAQAVWLGSVRRGLPVYWARTAVAGRDAVEDARIQASYAPEFTVVADCEQIARAVSAAGFDRPVVASDHRRFASALSQLAARPVYGDGRLVALPAIPGGS